MRIGAIYLHGFGSGPSSGKAALVREHLGARVSAYAVPQLDGGDFTAMTMTGIRARARAAIAEMRSEVDHLLVIGSSLGGYVAALDAGDPETPDPDALLLLAPAIGFPAYWRELLGAAGIAEWQRQGARWFFNHVAGEELPLRQDFLQSCLALPDVPPVFDLPCEIVHGRHDETVPLHWVEDYAAQLPDAALDVIDEDHSLMGEVGVAAIRAALDRLLARLDVDVSGRR